MPAARFPHLAQMLGAYFHQDCYADGASDEDILAEFIANKPTGFVAATAEEIERFLNAHSGGLLAALDAAFAPDIIIGESEAEARDWLTAAARRLRQGAA